MGASLKPNENSEAKVLRMMPTGMVPPHDSDIEEAVLGAVMCDARVVDELMLRIKSADAFYKEENRVVFTAMKALFVENQSIDIVTLGAKLSMLGKKEFQSHLITISSKTFSSAHIETHIAMLVQFWVKRQLVIHAQKQMVGALNEGVDVFDLLRDVSKGLDQTIECTQLGGETKSIPTVLNEIVKRVEVLSSRSSEQITGFTSGIQKIDLVTSGWQPTDLIVVAARPGMGKTAFVLRTVLENVMRGLPVGFFSCEMSTNQLVTRMIANESHFHMNQLFRTGFEKPEYFSSLRGLTDSMKNWPMFFDDESIHLTDMIAKMRLWKRKHGIKLLIIDYLQLISCDGKSSGNREQEIATITRKLKRMAKELEVPIILLSQLSRKVEERPDKRPRLADLRESGAIEQDADMVCFLYRPGYYGIELDDDFLKANANAEFIIAKHRNGSLDRIGIFFDENKAKYRDPYEYTPDEDFTSQLPKIDPINDDPF